jgi:hypothetical protein
MGLQKIPELVVELRRSYTSGFEIRVLNVGEGIAENISLDIASWADSAPAPTLKVSKSLRNLVGGMDSSIDVGLFELDNDFRPYNSHSGYIVATCSRCGQPKAWWFYFKSDVRLNQMGKLLELHEFEYLQEQPFGWFPRGN